MSDPAPKKLEKLYAFLSADPEGEEAVMAFYDDTNSRWIPMIGGDLTTIESMKPVAKAMADAVGIKVKLVAFSTREELGNL